MNRLDHLSPSSMPFEVTEQPYRGVTQTIEAMRELGRAGQSDPTVRRWAERVIQKVTPKDHLSEAAAIYYAACRQVRFTRDPANVEYLQHPALVLKNRHADCDDLSTLLAAALASVGNEMQFVAVGFTSSGRYTHVFLQFRDPLSGKVVVVDPVAGPYTDEMLRKIRRSRTYWVDGR